MTTLDYDFDEVTEAKPVPKGYYELQITGADLTESGENSKHPGSPMIRVSLGFVDLDLNAPNITHYISLPYGEGDENEKFKLLMLKRFCAVFSAELERGVELENFAMSLPGHTGNCEVDLTAPNDNGDVFNRLKLPRLSNESGHGRGRPPR